MTIKIFKKAGPFAENKDAGRELRMQKILPAIDNGEEVILDFSGVESATQSFIHSLISDVLRQHGDQVLQKLKFKSCAPSIKTMIGIVVDYMHNAMEDTEMDEEE
jgi:hypothetical protein